MNCRSAIRIGIVCLLAASFGCAADTQRPNWFNPGPAGYQRYQAAQGPDPYPSPDLGPEVVGARPRGFQKPIPEFERERKNAQLRVSSVPAPYVTPPPYASAPVAAPTGAPGYPVAPPPIAAPSLAPGAAAPAPAYTAPPVFSQPY